MKKPSVDELLSGSSPSFAPSVATEAALDALVLETRDRSREGAAPGRRRSAWLVPGAALAAVVALTAGAVVVDEYTRVDVPIAIEYTTDTGRAVACTATIRGGSAFTPKSGEVVDYYRTHEFAGVGQRIYEYALVLAGDRPGSRDLLPDSVDWLPDEDFEAYTDSSALSDSMVSFLLIDVLQDLGLGSTSGGADLSSDCTGELH